MSDSVEKYYELLEEGKLLNETPNQQAVGLIVEVIKAGNLDTLLKGVLELSLKNPHLTPRMVFEIVGEELRVGEVCNKEKQDKWNNQD
jgi:hypothetical protein